MQQGRTNPRWSTHHLYTSRINEKIRRIVHDRISCDPKLHPKNRSRRFQMDGLAQIMDSTKSMPVRIMWGLVFVACLAICSFQCWTRMKYYVSEPIAIDVKILDQEKVEFPGFSISIQNPNGLQALSMKFNKTQFTALECLNPIQSVLSQGKGMNVNEIWRLLNTRERILDVHVITRNKHYGVKRIEEAGPAGGIITLELDKAVPYGGIDTMFAVKINSSADVCKDSQIMGSVQPVGLPPDIRMIWAFTSGTTLEFALTLLKYEFVSRRAKPCVDTATYLRCNTQCEVRKFLDLPCRFPFLTSELPLEPCYLTGNATLRKLYLDILFKSLLPRCDCVRRCREMTFSSGMNYIRHNEEPISSLSWYFDHNRMVIIKERISYDIVNLMSDAGGNLGLCMGLSILSIVNIFYDIVCLATHRTRIRRRWHQVKRYFRKENGITQRVTQIFYEQLHKPNESTNVANELRTFREEMFTVQKTLRLAVILTCCAASFFFIYIRIRRYSSSPTQIIVEILDPNTVHFPMVTICGHNLHAIKLYRKFAKQKKQYRLAKLENFTMLDWCSVQLTDVLDIAKLSPDILWSKSSVCEEFLRSWDLVEMFAGFSIIRNVSMKKIALPEGECIEYNIGEQIHIGSQTMFITATRNNAFLKYRKEMIECERFYYTVYLTPPNKKFHPNTRLLMPYTRKSQFMLEYQKVTRLNLQKSPCSDFDTFNKCYDRCFEKVLVDLKIKCRLPFMPFSLNLSVCNNRIMGNAARKLYLDWAVTFDPMKYKNCGCVQTCEETIVKCIEYTEPMDMMEMTLMAIPFFTNIQQHFKEVHADSLSSVVSDVGGNLGLTMGVSLLFLFKLAESLLMVVLRKLKQKWTHTPKNGLKRNRRIIADSRIVQHELHKITYANLNDDHRHHQKNIRANVYVFKL